MLNAESNDGLKNIADAIRQKGYNSAQLLTWQVRYLSKKWQKCISSAKCILHKILKWHLYALKKALDLYCGEKMAGTRKRRDLRMMHPATWEGGPRPAADESVTVAGAEKTAGRA